MFANDLEPQPTCPLAARLQVIIGNDACDSAGRRSATVIIESRIIRAITLATLFVIMFGLVLGVPSTGYGVLTAQTASDIAAVETLLGGIDQAFSAKDLNRLATYYDPSVTIFEGGGINNGWADYRDRHLKAELDSYSSVQLRHTQVKVTILPGGQSAYTNSHYTLKANVRDRGVDSEGHETLVLIKTSVGWKIRHSHSSVRLSRLAQ